MREGKLSRALFWRGTHRMLGDPTIGTITGFLTGIFLIRVSANIYLSIYLANTGSTVDIIQIASTHFVILSAYIILVGSLATFRISLALPELCFIDFSPYRRRFRSGFIRQTAVLRPMNITSITIIIFMAFIFSIIFGLWNAIMFRASIVLFFTFSGFLIVIKVLSIFHPGRSEIQILELLYILLLVSLNPDTGSFQNQVSIFFSGNYSSIHSVLEIISIIGLIVMAALLILLLLKMLSTIDNLFHRQLPSHPLEKWYWRFFQLRFWMLLYILITPVFISSFIPISTKGWILILFILFSALSYSFFINHCENTLREKWRMSLFEAGNIRLITRSVLIHTGLTLIPVLGYIIVK